MADVNHLAIEHTCALCGRVGSRRFEQADANAWWCTDREACKKRRGLPAEPVVNESDQAEHTPPVDAPTPAVEPPSDIPAKTIPANVTPPEPKPAGPAITARCQDCTRTFTLTDRLLDQAVEMHERRHGHIVRVMGEASDA